MKTAIVLGGTGFIGHHLARRLKSEGYYVRVVDIKPYEYGPNDYADEVLIYDLRNPVHVEAILRLDTFPNDNINGDPIILPFNYLPTPFANHVHFDEVYCLAATMGGAGFVFVGEHDADIMHDSALINLNVVYFLAHNKFKGKIFYSSSACMYPQELQTENASFVVNKDHSKLSWIGLRESDAYPLNPDSDYGLEKAFSERLFLAYARNYGIDVRIARFHNIYGPEGTYAGGREKAPAAMCRKVIESNLSVNKAYIEVWGDGKQTRSFLYIDDCIDAVRLLMQSDFREPINIGSEEMVSINTLAQMAIDLSGKDIKVKNVPSNTIGVKGRNSDNTLIRKVLNWEPKYSLKEGLEKTFFWIKSQI
jgi:nucleoside-diphosphate-sugar epimerase